MRWLLDNVPELRRRPKRATLLFGNIDTFLVWQLTGGAQAACTSPTSPTPAARN